MEKLFIEFLKNQKDDYQKRGLIPTLDLLIEDLEKIVDEDEKKKDFWNGMSEKECKDFAKSV